MLSSTVTESAIGEIGQRLALARRRRGWSVSAMARRLGVDRRTLAQLEAGQPTVSLGVFVEALAMLDLLRGLGEALRPENDLAAISSEIRRARAGSAASRAIPDERVDF
ncbi:MAG: helix-turn-helix transcriptional regulator [Elusimicrobia bacterium]|nr:helix-turn-helix transcriptional regulator [Elusimicrobiota bacterium]